MVKQSLWFRLLLTILTVLTIGLTQSSSTSAASITSTNLGDEIVISDLSSADFRPKIAYNSIHDEYLVVWESAWAELPGYPHYVYAQRVSANGRLLDKFLVASNINSQQMEPAVAYDSIHDRYLVVFTYNSLGDGISWDIYGRFLPWNGPSSGLLDFAICTWASDQRHPSIAFAQSAQEFLVTWTAVSSGQPSYISARRILSAGGFPAGDAFTVSSGTEYRNFSDVAYNLAQNEYLVTWQIDKGSDNFDIAGVRLDASGQPLSGGDSYQIGEFSIAGWPDREILPAVAACHDADQYLVAWQSDVGTEGTDYAIYARYLSGGAVLGSIHLVRNTISPQIHADISCDAYGTKYLLTWSEKYASGASGIWARFAYPVETLDPAFEVVAPGPLTDRLHPTVIGGKRYFLTAWEHYRDGNTNLDIHGRLIGFFLYLPIVIK